MGRLLTLWPFILRDLEGSTRSLENNRVTKTASHTHHAGSRYPGMHAESPCPEQGSASRQD